MNIKSFNEITVDIKFKDIVDKYSKDCAEYLKRTSPRGHRRSKTYASGWGVKVDERAKKEYEVIVWNETNYRLTHLLENGHLITNKRGGVGWASPKPHIGNAYQHIKEPFIRAMEKVNIDVDIK